MSETVIDSGLRICAGCERQLPTTAFWKRSSTPSGFQSRCKDCMKESNYEWRRQNPERWAELKRQSDVRQDVAGRRRARYASDPEYADRVRGHQHANYRRHPDYFKSMRMQREAQLKGARIETVSRRKLYERDNGVCGICHEHVAYEEMSVDHIIPLSKGGSHSYANTQVAHRSCNISKGAKMPDIILAVC